MLLVHILQQIDHRATAEKEPKSPTNLGWGNETL
jgi:hypothetical protein